MIFCYRPGYIVAYLQMLSAAVAPVVFSIVWFSVFIFFNSDVSWTILAQGIIVTGAILFLTLCWGLSTLFTRPVAVYVIKCRLLEQIKQYIDSMSLIDEKNESNLKATSAGDDQSHLVDPNCPTLKVLVVHADKHGGYFFIQIAKYLKEWNAHLEGIDVDIENYLWQGVIREPDQESFISKAQKEQVQQMVSMKFADARNLDKKEFPSESYDVVIILGWTSGSDFVHSGPGAISECVRVLKPNGRLLSYYDFEPNYAFYLSIVGCKNIRTKLLWYQIPWSMIVTAQKEDINASQSFLDLNNEPKFSKWVNAKSKPFASGDIAVGALSLKPWRWLWIRIFLILSFILLVVAYTLMIHFTWDYLMVPNGIPEKYTLRRMLIGVIPMCFMTIGRLWRSMMRCADPSDDDSRWYYLFLIFVAHTILVFVISMLISALIWAVTTVISIYLSSRIPLWALDLINASTSILLLTSLIVFLLSLVSLYLHCFRSQIRKQTRTKLNSEITQNDDEDTMRPLLTNSH